MNRLKQLREENNMTQLELSKKMNCAMSSIAMYENEARKPSMDVLIRLSEIFHCSIDYLLCKSDIRSAEDIIINIDEEDIAFARGVKALSETNKMIIKNTIEALLTKQEQDKRKME